jgi:hypothetical protein
MALPVTEIVYIPLKAGVDLDSPTPEAEIFQETLNFMAAQEDIQGGYSGRQIENPNILMLFVGKSISSPRPMHCTI